MNSVPYSFPSQLGEDLGKNFEFSVGKFIGGEGFCSPFFPFQNLGKIWGRILSSQWGSSLVEKDFVPHSSPPLPPGEDLGKNFAFSLGKFVDRDIEILFHIPSLPFLGKIWGRMLSFQWGSSLLGKMWFPISSLPFLWEDLGKNFEF